MSIHRRVTQLYLEKYNELVGVGEKEREAQKQAMKFAFEKSVTEFSQHCPSILWKAVHSAHVERKSGTELTIEQINGVISAEQSWKKSSGHAFEEFLVSFYAPSLAQYGVEICLQRDVSNMISHQQLSNRPRDFKLIEAWLAEGVFDLYVVASANDQKYIIGTMQAKTSIRDRVTRDREPAIQAIQGFFWATALVLDGEFLKMPKFQAMVNGGSKNFPHNGWHGMYVFSNLTVNDRIYRQSQFVSHCIQAKALWLSQRQEMDADWKPVD